MFFKGFLQTCQRNASFLSRETGKVIKSIINPPARIGNAYSMFYMERYQALKRQDANISITEAAKKIGQEWKALDARSKQAITEKSAQAKASHDAQKAAFKQSLTDRQKAALSLLRLANREGATRWDLNKKQKAFLDEMPKPPAFTGRGLFLSERLKGSHEAPGVQNAKLAEAMREWVQLSTSQQQSYEQQASANLSNFKSAMAEFLKH